MAERSVFARRYSCRSFKRTAVSDDELHVLLEAARWAPSAGNLQPWRFVVVRATAMRAALARAAFGQDFVAAAPVVIVVCAVPHESARRYGERGRALYCLQDTAATTQNLLLAATELGLGACWIGAFDEPAAAAAVHSPTGWRPVAIVPIGHPAESEPARTRRTLDEVVVFRNAPTETDGAR